MNDPTMTVAKRVDEEELGADDTSAAGRRESGIAPARRRDSGFPVDDAAVKANLLVQVALAENTRTEANLNLLLRGLQHLTNGASAALEANTQMATELDALRDLLGKGEVATLGLRQRLRHLELTLDNLRRETAMERSAFIDQEDRFLAELLGDHERELSTLRGHVGRAANVPPTPPRATIRPEPPAAAIGAVPLRTVRIPRPTRIPAPETLAPAREGAPEGPVSLHDRDTLPPSMAVPDTEPAPERPESAILLTRPTSKGPLPRKPELSTRPLVGYSKGRDEVAEEHLEGADLSPRTPT
jgi:hypothetical protein